MAQQPNTAQLLAQMADMMAMFGQQLSQSQQSNTPAQPAPVAASIAPPIAAPVASPIASPPSNTSATLDVAPTSTAIAFPIPNGFVMPKLPAPASAATLGVARHAQALVAAEKTTPFHREQGVPSVGQGIYKQKNRQGGYAFGGHPLQQTSRPPKNKSMRLIKVSKVNKVS